MNEATGAKTDNQLPPVGKVILCPEGEAFIHSKEYKNQIHYSVTANRKDGKWTLNKYQQNGLRIMLGVREPSGPVTRVQITKHCKQLTCCFGIVN